MKIAIASITVILASTIFSNSARAEHRYDRTMHRLANAMEDVADDLYREVKLHYRHRRDYDRLRHAALEIEHKSDHIKGVVDRHGSLRHIREDLEQIDRSLHEVQDIVGHSDHRARRHGEPHFNRRHVREDLHRLEEIVHDMREFMDRVPAPVRPVVVRPQPRPVVVHRDYSRGGISFGSKWGRIHFRF
jgi:hypothetical protein